MNLVLSYQQPLLLLSFQVFLHYNGQNYQETSESSNIHLCPPLLLTIIIKGEMLGKIYAHRPDCKWYEQVLLLYMETCLIGIHT